MNLDIANLNIKCWVDIFSALLTPTVAILGIYIAWQQWLTNERKRKQDLFEKRWNLYKRIRTKFFELVNLCMHSNEKKESYYTWGSLFYNETIPEKYKNEFRKQLQKSCIFYEFREEIYFLFGEEVYYRLECLQNKEMYEIYKNCDFYDYFEEYFKDVFSKYLCVEPQRHLYKKINPKKFAEIKQRKAHQEKEKIYKRVNKNLGEENDL